MVFVRLCSHITWLLYGPEAPRACDHRAAVGQIRAQPAVYSLRTHAMTWLGHREPVWITFHQLALDGIKATRADMAWHLPQNL